MSVVYDCVFECVCSDDIIPSLFFPTELVNII